ncbi:hypothetical protein [Leifsonia soli]|uniref:Uncharacterized protein n=1 Tax=Leifsonia soli TaxID=582665 RepID=A0A852SYS9_9MICO|nr:hypothetical protein [Leifsonia soli]NYD74299.1 hypothetical protein [Leifsonia soli]
MASFGLELMASELRADLPSARIDWGMAADLGEWSVIESRHIFYRKRVGFLLAWGEFRDCNSGLLLVDGVRRTTVSRQTSHDVFNWELGGMDVAVDEAQLHLTLTAMNPRNGRIELWADALQLLLGSTPTDEIPDLSLGLASVQQAVPTWHTAFTARYADNVSVDAQGRLSLP